MLEEEISTLKRELIEDATLAEKMIVSSIRGLRKKDKELLLEVIQKDEPKENAYEIELDELCMSIIAQYEPKAKSLRTVLMILKMSNDLERIGDHAVNIAQSALYLLDNPFFNKAVESDIEKMAEVASGMLAESLNAFIHEDAVLAKQICERDTIVDELQDKVLKEIIGAACSAGSDIKSAFHLVRIAGNLERIADLSTNICEDVVFVVEGKVIKHHIADGP
jgi:phosphate transport system protein